ncbi:nucleoside diphosphate kinase homolog 5-like [Neodiprion fabricii]|uniref:nucleoside diphosphate kinase homolog 5-like n=1 Tax=Neodiprion fabricii TaxID=2872261 RepID=UPI001ED8F690|nr:nucleoside diphosphate kinase homolog 5-like [Neodiprion fabricii]
MCDCPQDQNSGDSDTGNACAVSQVHIFDKCKGTQDPEDPGNWKLMTLFEPPVKNDDVGIDETPKPPSSQCSSDSTREYEFVNSQDYEYLCGEEEVPEYPLIPCKPCEPGEEEEEAEPDVECTLAIIKPEAVACRKEIEDRILEEGFEIYQTRWLQLTPEQTSDFYTDRYGQVNFAHLVAYMSSAPIIAMVLAKQGGIQDWRHAMGPTKVTEARLYYPDSIRARFGRRGEDFKNAVHGSASREQAEREIHFFFPEFIIEPLLRGETAADYLWEVINNVLLEGLTLCCKRKPADPILWLANWLILNNPNDPKLPDDLAMIPT